MVLGASSCEILNAASGLKLIDVALQRRRVAETEMNRQSSRGHCVVLITVIKRNLSTSTSKIGQLYAVDLAGSESIGKTQVQGHQLSEAGSINKSLLTLGRVIHALVASGENKTTKKKNKPNKKIKPRIPFRDSNLTRLLQNSLGGNARAALVVNVSPASWNMQETISTLRFGASTSKILNKPTTHEVHGLGSLKTLLRQCKETINRNSIALKQLNEELLTYQDFFAMIRCVPKENLPQALRQQLGSGAVNSEMLLLEESFVDVKRKRRANQKKQVPTKEKKHIDDSSVDSAEGGFLGVAASTSARNQKAQEEGRENSREGKEGEGEMEGEGDEEEEEEEEEETRDRPSLRTASGGLSALLRTNSFVETEEVQAAKNRLKEEEEGTLNKNKEEEEAQNDLTADRNEVNRHLGSLLRTMSEEEAQ